MTESYVVNAKDCKGCLFFGRAASGNDKCCEYYYRTGQHRSDESTVKHCKEKKVGTHRERIEMTRYEFGSKVRHKFY